MSDCKIQICNYQRVYILSCKLIIVDLTIRLKMMFLDVLLYILRNKRLTE